MSASPDLFCQYLPWDTQFFGKRIARILPAQLNEQDLALIEQWGQEQHIDCFYFLSDFHPPTVQVVERSRFHLVDIRMELVYTFPTALPAAIYGSVRAAQPQDQPWLAQLARSSFRNTRFYNDPHFSRQDCDTLYETWIIRSCEDYADVVLIVEGEAKPAGFITGQVREEAGQIGLVAVDPIYQGKGLGKLLLKGALAWFAEKGVASVAVVTQGQNYAAQRLYQQTGFLTRKVQLWYHKWADFDDR